MSGSRWDQPGVPHKGWHCVDVVDLRADGEPADDTDYATCQMCGNEKIRYVHIMEHPDVEEALDVGCVCAEKMSDDYDGPKRREARLRNRASRRTRWLHRKWRVSAKGNSFLNVDGRNLVVYPTKTGRWGYKIGDRFGPKTYPTVREAKLALFDDFWAATQDNDQLWATD
ncbi:MULTISPECIES: hypothetical protein [unclassified Cupriavidus]|uniref:hypothetical protein n=1 Tax=unclassified Cupriavidus TaxID=2640874 RepID=UPI00064948FC